MSQFPHPVLPPDSIDELRRERQKRLLVAAWKGACFRSAVVGIELMGFIWWGSAALLVDALASLMDIAATVVLAICIRLAGRPPDADHPFGHGRYEPLAGFQLGVLMAVVGLFLLVQQGREILNHEAIASSIPPMGWLIPLFAIALLECGYRQAMHSAKRYGSSAMVVEAWHYRIDALNSAIALAALSMGALVPEWSGVIDHIGAFGIAGFMLVMGILCTLENMHQLLDHVPDASYFCAVERAARRVSGVEGTEKVRIQLYGPDAHVDIDVEVDPKLTVDAAHRITQYVRAEIQKEWASVRDVTVHVEPYYPKTPNASNALG